MEDSNKIKEPNTEGRAERTKAERVQRFAELAMAYRSSEEERNIDAALEKLTPETALNFLQHINGQLRSDGRAKKSEIYGSEDHRMMVDDSMIDSDGEKEFVAPEPDLQKELIGEYLDAIKKTDGREKKALLAYYAINNLHLFSDGNGRTSRAVYLLLKNGDLSDMNNMLAHNRNRNIVFSGDSSERDDGFGRRNFISENKIKPAERINIVANMFLQEQLEKEGVLGDDFKGKYIYVESALEKGGLVAVKMLKENREALSDKEIKSLRYAMSDGLGRGTYSTLSGLTMAIMLQKKGLAKKTVESNLIGGKKLPIRVNYYGDSDKKATVRETFAEWTPGDYREILKTYREIKKRQNEMIMKFFTEDVRSNEGLSVAEWAMGKVK